jgi:hypothetical protein
MKIKNSKELEARITELQKRKVIQESLLISQVNTTVDSLKPINLIRNTFSNIRETPEVRNNILKSIAGFGLGMLTKRLFIGKSKSLVSKMLSTGLELGMAKAAVKQTDKLRAYGIAVYNNIFSKNHKNNHKPTSTP